MLHQLFEAIINAWGWLSPIVVIPVYQAAGVLRFGHYSRTLDPGLHWKFPLIEEVIPENTVMTTLRLQPQTCTTKDGKAGVVCGVLKYRLTDVEPYICGLVDQRDALIDVTMGAVLAAVRDTAFDEIVETPPEAKVATAVRRQVNKFGFEILAFTFTDIGQVRSIRIISHTPLDNELGLA